MKCQVAPPRRKQYGVKISEDIPNVGRSLDIPAANKKSEDSVVCLERIVHGDLFSHTLHSCSFAVWQGECEKKVTAEEPELPPGGSNDHADSRQPDETEQDGKSKTHLSMALVRWRDKRIARRLVSTLVQLLMHMCPVSKLWQHSKSMLQYWSRSS